MTTATPKARLMTQSFALRDDEASCADCKWTWKQPDSGAYDRSGGGRAAKKHAQDNAHQTTVRRVQYLLHEGLS